ncbi:hypothetical protein NLZ15_22675 (plasmid) [Atlantibacter subterranea]|uniref:hypothetical protein n=1 Tax=Atlantibacter subterraneus TaxID=255519 RepID=UPI0020C43ED9|nr:hypothetical protein [Atlantibacter subterranea]UTJ49801.1 hypothetical protein NLZ15_22675 [Atlantibacter subterranea]
MTKRATSLNALLRDKNTWFFELDALREQISDRDFIQNVAESLNCDHIERTTPYITVGSRNFASGCLKEADYNNPSEHYRRFFFAKKGDFIPVDGYDRLIVVSSLDLQEIYVQRGGRGRQKLVNIADLVRILANLGETGEVKL